MTYSNHSTLNPSICVPAQLKGLDYRDFNAVYTRHFSDLSEPVRVEFMKCTDPNDWRMPTAVFFQASTDPDIALFVQNAMGMMFGTMGELRKSELGTWVVGQYVAW